MDIAKKINELTKIFNIKNQISVEIDNTNEPGIASLNEETIIFINEDLDEKDFIKLIATAKLGEKHPLLGVFYFQENYNESEAFLIEEFIQYCLPLKEAWIYRTIREYYSAFYWCEPQNVYSKLSILFLICQFIFIIHG